MTCAGLLGLAVGHALRPQSSAGPRQVKDLAVNKALAFLGQFVGKSKPLSEKERADLRQRTRQVKDAQEKFLALLRQRHDLIERKPLDAQDEFRARLLNIKKSPEEVRIEADLEALYPTKHLQGQLVQADGWGDLYFLWSLECVAVAYNLPTIAGKDWYGWGSSVIVAAQNDDGSWSDAFPGVVDTCFALLFLKRANVAKDLSQALARQGRFPDGSPSQKKEP